MVRTYGLSVSIGIALLILGAVPASCFAGTVFAFDYFLPTSPEQQAQGSVTISAMGTLTATFEPASGDYIVSSITGTRTVGGVLSNITGLLAPGAYFNSNVIYPASPLLDINGISFTVDNAALSDDGVGDVNVFFDPITGQYAEFYPSAVEGTFTISPANTPEPPTGTVLIVATLIASVLVRRRGSLGTAS